MCLALLVTNIARAEGSIQLNPNDDGKRTYLEYKSGASFGVVGTSTLYVVARAGETITLAGSILNSYDGNDIVVTSVKDGRVWSFDVTESIGFIANRAAEKAGPYYPASGTRGNRYMPLTFTVPFDGVYSVVFHTMNGWNVIPADYNPADQRCDDYWEQSYYHNADHSQGDGIAAWDISVFDTADNLQTGRVFASYLVISDGDIGTINGADGIYAKLYLLTHDGYLYRINTNGFDPDGMTFYADNVGMIDNGSNQTLYKHTNNQNVIGGDVSIVYPNCDMEYDRMTHRIFFNEPDNSITDILNIATTPQGYADITCDKITFSGNRIASDNSGIANEGMGGVFKVSFSKACTYELIIDTNKDGNFDGSDLVMMDAASAGDNIMLWNGKDANGNKLPSGTYEVRVKVHAGELHLPMSDLEDNVNGYELYLANTLASGSSSFSDERQYRIWYDGSDYETFNGTQVLMHSDVSGSLIGNGATTVYEPNPYKVSYDETLSSKIGSDGKGGFLFYSQSSAYNRGYGNNRILDVWTYSTSADALYGTFTISDDSDAYAYVTGTAYFDKDGDGVYDSGENPAGGLTVILCDRNKKVVYDANGDTIKAVTNYGGKYAFAGVPYTEGATTNYYIYVYPDMQDGNAYSITNKNATGQYIPLAVSANEVYKQDIFGIGDFDVKLSISASTKQIYSGDAITFTLKVTNISTSTTVTDVYVNIPQLLPENISGDEVVVVQDKTSDTYVNGIWTVGTLKPNETHTLKLTVHPISSVDATFTQTATALINNASGDCNEENNTASVSYKVIHVETATIVYDCNGCGETITYDIDNVELFNAGLGTVSNTVIDLPTSFVRDCYTFLGWGEDENISVSHTPGDKIADLVGGDELHMYAIWQGDDISYTVNHYAMVDGVKTITQVASSQTLTAKVGDVVSPLAVSVTGYTYAEADAAATLECGKQTVFNVYYEPKDIKITWYVNAGAYVSETQKYGTTISAKNISSVTTLTDDGSSAYAFVGWSLQKNGAVITDWSAQTATENVTYYAIISELKILAPNNLIYDGTQKKATTIADSNWTSSVGTIYYVGIGGTSYSKSATAPTNAGTYTASVTSGTHTISVTFTIEKADITPTVTIANWKEGNTASTPSVSGNLGNGTVIYTYYIDEACSTKTSTATARGKANSIGGQPTVAGTYYLVASIAETTNYNASTAQTSFMITTYTVTAPKARTLTYTGNAQQLATAGSVDNNSYVLRYSLDNYTYTTNIASLKGTEAGTYTLYYEVYKQGYLWGERVAGPSYITITIAKAAASCTVKGNTLTYNATNQQLVTASAVSGGTLYYRLSTSDTWSTTIPTASAVGLYTIYYYVAGDANHEDSEVASVTATIEKASVTVVAEDNSKVYGNADPTLTYTVSGLYGSDMLIGSLERVVGENVGTYKINQGSLDGGANYTIKSFTSATFTITKADAVLPIVTFDNLVYNGQLQRLVGVDDVENGTIMFSTNNSTWSSTIPSKKDVGTYTIYYYLNGDSNHNNSDVHKVTVTIEPKTLDIVADDITKAYGESDPALTYSVTGLVGTDALSGTLTRESGEGIGTYVITQGSLTCSSNYIISSFTNAIFTITNSTPTVTAPTAKTLTYTGSAQSLATAGKAVGGTMYYSLDNSTWSTTIPTGVEVGSYTIYYYVKGDENHDDSEIKSVSVSIVAKELIITALSASKVYGNSDPTLTYSVNGLVGRDVVSGLLHRQMGEDVGIYAINQGSLSAGANYNITFIGADFTITKASFTTLNVTIGNWIYGTSAQLPLVSGNASNGAVAYTYYVDADMTTKTSIVNGAASDGNVPANVGTYYLKAVVAETENYKSASATTSFSITEASSEVIAPTYTNITYNGEVQQLLTNGATTDCGTVYYSLDNTTWTTNIPSAINVGTYTVYYYVKGDNNHTDSDVEYVTVTISKASLTHTSPMGLSLTYNGNAQELVYAGTSEKGTLYYSLDNATWQTTIPTATDVGEYTIYYYVDGGDNYNNTTVASVKTTIAKADLSLTLTMASWTYGESASEPMLNGNLGNGTVTYKYYTDEECTIYTTGNGQKPNYQGSFYVKATVAATKNYNTGTAIASFVISPAGVNIISPVANELTYNGTAQELVTAGSVEGGTLYYRIGTDSEKSVSVPTATEAGTYTVYYWVEADDNHSNTSSTAIIVTIKEAQSTATEPIAAVVEYNGNAQSLIAEAGIATGGTIYYSLDGVSWSSDVPTATEVGSYTVYYYVKADANYKDSEVKNVTANILSQLPSVVNPTALNLVYNGLSQALIIAGSSADGVFKYRMNEDAAWTTEMPTGIEVGEYIIYVKFFGDANHSDIEMPELIATIAKAEVEIPIADDTEYVYDGIEKTYNVATNPLYTISGATHTDAGQYNVIVSLVDANNYMWSDGTSEDKVYTMIIKKLLIDIPANSDFQYNNQEKIYTLAESEYYTTTSVTDDDKYIVTVSLTDKDNTSWTDGTTDDKVYTFSIVADDLIVVMIPSADNSEYVYNGTEQTYQLTESSYYTISGNVQTEVGTYTVTVSLTDPSITIWSDGTVTDKYYTFVIRAKAINRVTEPTTTQTHYEYNGEEQTIDIPASNDYTISNGTHTNAGTYEVVISLTDKENSTWEDGTTDDKIIIMILDKLKVQIPNADTTTYYYTTREITYTLAESDKYIVSGNVQVEVGSYIVEVALADTANCVWTDGTVGIKEYGFVINEPVQLEEAFIIRLWDDVLCVDNASGYFYSYQWYKNGEKIDGANGQYYNDPNGISGTYYCIVNGSITIGPKTYEALNSISMKAYGNRSTAKIEVSGLLDEEDGNVLIYDVSGVCVATMQATSINNILSVTLPQGIYIVQLNVGNTPTATSKIIVK